MAKKSSRGGSFRGYISEQRQALFPKGTSFRTGEGRLRGWAAPMALDSKRVSKRGTTRVFTGKQKITLGIDKPMTGATTPMRNNGKFLGYRTRDSWGAPKGGKNVISLKNLKEMVLCMKISEHMLSVQASAWSLLIAYRAKAIFQESFTMKRFNSANSKAWKANTSWTVKKRKWKHTWPGAGKLMMEYGKICSNFDVKSKGAVARTYTYGHAAALHNNPPAGATYGNGFGGKYNPPKPFVQRQFMGHSSLMRPFMLEYENKYWFRSVFRGPRM